MPAPGGTNAWGDQDGGGSGQTANLGGFERRAHQAVDSSIHGLAHAQRDQIAHGARIAQVRQIRFVEAGEHGDGQQPKRAVAPALDGGAHDGPAPVDRQEPHAALGHLRHGPLHRFADVIELHVEEDPFFGGHQLADKLHAGGGIQLHADLVEIDAIAEALDERARLRGGIDIQGDDETGPS